MKLLYYTKPPFLDCDLPYLKEQKKNSDDIFTIIDLSPFSLQSSLLDISVQSPKSGIYKATTYREILFFKDFIDIDKTYVVNRTSAKVFSIANLILNIKLFFFIFKLNPDIIHSTVFYDIQELLLYFFKKKTILTVHDPFPHSGESSNRKSLSRKLGFILLSNFVILNKVQKEEFIAAYNLENKTVHVSNLSIYSVYDLYAKEHYAQSPSNSILFFGRISPYKGIDLLLEAMKEVHKHFPDLKLIIAGNGKYYFDKTEYEKLDYIEFRNRYIPNSELVQLINESLFTVCPYTDATQSGVIMTAYAFCKPVVASNVGGLSEVVIDQVTGRLVESNSIIELQKILIELLSNQNFLVSMKKDIFDLYHQGEKGWVRISQDLLQVYKLINIANKKNIL